MEPTTNDVDALLEEASSLLDRAEETPELTEDAEFRLRLKDTSARLRAAAESPSAKQARLTRLANDLDDVLAGHAAPKAVNAEPAEHEWWRELLADLLRDPLKLTLAVSISVAATLTLSFSIYHFATGGSGTQRTKKTHGLPAVWTEAALKNCLKKSEPDPAQFPSLYDQAYYQELAKKATGDFNTQAWGGKQASFYVFSSHRAAERAADDFLRTDRYANLYIEKNVIAQDLDADAYRANDAHRVRRCLPIAVRDAKAYKRVLPPK